MLANKSRFQTYLFICTIKQKAIISMEQQRRACVGCKRHCLNMAEYLIKALEFQRSCCQVLGKAEMLQFVHQDHSARAQVLGPLPGSWNCGFNADFPGRNSQSFTPSALKCQFSKCLLISPNTHGSSQRFLPTRYAESEKKQFKKNNTFKIKQLKRRVKV